MVMRFVFGGGRGVTLPLIPCPKIRNTYPISVCPTGKTRRRGSPFLQQKNYVRVCVSDTSFLFVSHLRPMGLNNCNVANLPVVTKGFPIPPRLVEMRFQCEFS